MKPVHFKGDNHVVAVSQEPYLPLPVHVDNCAEVIITSCWKMSVGQRIKCLFTGKIYVQLMTFGKPLQPQKVSVENPVRHD